MRGWVFLFPGQGSQYVGMGRDFYESYMEVEKIFHEANDIVGMDIKKLCFEGPENELVLTKNVQPAITVVNVACLKVLELHGIQPVASAGHSLGEYSALFAAGVIDFKTLMLLVKHRGQFMEDASREFEGSMVAMMAATKDQVEHICRVAEVEVANINSPEQIILTGKAKDIDKAVEEGKKVGVRKSIRLNVSGPWHSRWMRQAAARLEPFLSECIFRDPLFPVITNIDAQPLKGSDSLREKLRNQIYSPVLWQSSMEWFIREGYANFVEVGPKQVLSSLMKKIGKTLNESIQVEHVEDVSTLASFLTVNQSSS